MKSTEPKCSFYDCSFRYKSLRVVDPKKTKINTELNGNDNCWSVYYCDEKDTDQRYKVCQSCFTRVRIFYSGLIGAHLRKENKILNPFGFDMDLASGKHVSCAGCKKGLVIDVGSNPVGLKSIFYVSTSTCYWHFDYRLEAGCSWNKRIDIFRKVCALNFVRFCYYAMGNAKKFDKLFDEYSEANLDERFSIMQKSNV